MTRHVRIYEILDGGEGAAPEGKTGARRKGD
jgi:hypothetical protein